VPEGSKGGTVILLSRADPFLNDQNFVLSVLTLEELGATGNKVCFQLFTAFASEIMRSNMHA
jgi:hypothetical protein